MALESNLCTEWGSFLLHNHHGNCIVSFSLIFKMFCTVFTLSYSLTSERARLPKSCFLEERSTMSLKHYMPTYYSLSVHRGWEMTAQRVVCVSWCFVFCAKCCRFEVDTEKWLLTEDDLFHFKTGVWNQWEWRGEVRVKAQTSLFWFSYLNKGRWILSKVPRLDSSTAFVAVFCIVGMNNGI